MYFLKVRHALHFLSPDNIVTSNIQLNSYFIFHDFFMTLFLYHTCDKLDNSLTECIIQRLIHMYKIKQKNYLFLNLCYY